MENKNGKGKTIAIVILVVLLLGALGYIVYDKAFTKEETKDEVTTSKKTEEVVKEPQLLTSEEALSIGKDLYIKTRDIAYNQSGNMQVDENVCYAYENNQMKQVVCGDFPINKVTDVSFKNNFTAKGLKQYEEKATEYGGGGFIVYNNDYYIASYKFGPFDGLWNTDAVKFEVKQINENIITLEATETFGDDVGEPLNLIKTSFTIAKENGNWKMDDYTDAGYLCWSGGCSN